MKSKHWIFALGALFLICGLLSAMFFMESDQASYAQVYSDGELVCVLDLRVAQTLTVEGSNGTNVISVKDGSVAVTAADCPDGYCMKRGFCNGGVQIVCLPNRMVIKFLKEINVDAAVG